MIHHVEITLRLRSPLCIARRPTAPGQPVETLPYVSGTVLRGGLASAWLAGREYRDLSSTDKDRFRALFLSLDITYGNCWPVQSKNHGVLVDVVPQTAWSDKHAGGWLTDGSLGVFDQLTIFLRDEETDRQLDRFNTTPFAAYSNGAYTEVSRRERLIARTAIEPVRSTARPAFLYTLTALEAGQEFRGVVSGDDSLLQDLRSNVLHVETVLTMGQGRSRGLGEVAVTQVEDVEMPLPHRIDQLGKILKDVADVDGENIPSDEHGLLVASVMHFNRRLGTSDELALPITLESDVLLRDDYLLPSSDPRLKVTLQRYLGVSAPTSMRLDPQGVVQSTRWIGGWDQLRGLPRAPQLAVTMASVWTFRVDPHELGAAVDWWMRAQTQGVGERRNEGFGRVRLCHPVHLAENPQ